LKKVTRPTTFEEPPGQSSGTASRAQGARCLEREFITGADAPGLTKGTRPTNVKKALAPLAQSIASTSYAACSKSQSNNEGSEQLGNSQSATSVVEKDVQQLCDTVVKQCCFLRISSTELHDEMSKKAKKHGSIATFRLCVNGLPLTKRSKWLGPLLWSVSAVLQRQGCPCKVQGNDLYVPVNDGTTQVRIDVVAARV